MLHEDTGSTTLEERLYNELAQALVWLEHVAMAHGDEALVDCCPNGWGGRVAIRDALKDAEEMHPELASFPIGTCITDGIVRGFVLARVTWQTGYMPIPAYEVDIGGGRTTLIPCDQAQRA